MTLWLCNSLSNHHETTVLIISLTHDIIVSFFLTDDHTLIVAGHVLAVVHGLSEGSVPKRTCTLLITNEYKKKMLTVLQLNKIVTFSTWNPFLLQCLLVLVTNGDNTL